MAEFKRVLCQRRLRQVPPQFSWVDHRLVRDRHISRCSADALALYLFLVTVADGQGLSYYADPTVSRLLPLDEPAVGRARRELIDNHLIAYQRPLYQVLALGSSQPPPPPPPPPPQSSRPFEPTRSSRQQSSARRPSPPRTASEVDAGPQSIAQIIRRLTELDSKQDKDKQDKP
jgi:hypothetical protein